MRFSRVRHRPMNALQARLAWSRGFDRDNKIYLQADLYISQINLQHVV